MIKPGPNISMREMGLSEDEFWRSLSPALSGLEYTIEGRTIIIEFLKGRIVIQLHTAFERKIGSLKLPVLPIELRYSDLSQSERQMFLNRFDRHFQRGGG